VSTLPSADLHHDILHEVAATTKAANYHKAHSFFDYHHHNDHMHDSHLNHHIYNADHDNMFFNDYQHGHHNVHHNVTEAIHHSDNKDQKLNPYFLGGMGVASPDVHLPAGQHNTLFRDELMAGEPISDWHPLSNIGEVPSLLHTGTVNNNAHVHEDSYFNFDMKI